MKGVLVMEIFRQIATCQSNGPVGGLNSSSIYQHATNLNSNYIYLTKEYASSGNLGVAVIAIPRSPNLAK